MIKRLVSAIILLTVICAVTACTTDDAKKSASKSQSGLPAVTDKLNYDSDGLPVISVYIKSDDRIEEMDIETYIQGVLAGEMKNDWPIEALKAQAILARTYTLKFLDTKTSKYNGADISTDVTEAQAYNSAAINDRIKQAVDETRGIVMVYNDELPYAWFHAHSGGMTELPTVALDYNENPSYLLASASADSEKAPDSVKNWQVDFDFDEIEEACSDCGLEVHDIENFTIGKTGESGRAETFIINDKEISAPSFRINIGADKLKSTLIDDIEIDDDGISFSGRGYGHGVGMSQWGAYALAEKGATAQTIVNRYFKGIRFVDLWE